MSKQKVTDQPRPKSLAEYEKILGVGHDYTPESVLQTFLVSYQVREENGELDQLGPELEAKNKIMQSLVSAQMKVQRYFEIVSPFVNSCIACRGTGEIYKFNQKTVKINCHICAGKKKVKVDCPACEGSGRYVKKWKGGGGINVKCRKCKGSGKVYAQCSECLGEGKKKKMVLSHVIKSTTPCKKCKQLGFTSNNPLPKKKKKRPAKTPELANPVISQSLADKIKASMKTQD